jgi:hypothetical protein
VKRSRKDSLITKMNSPGELRDSLDESRDNLEESREPFERTGGTPVFGFHSFFLRELLFNALSHRCEHA